MFSNSICMPRGKLHQNSNWLLGDHLGSTSMVTDASGVMVSEVRYSAFGEVRYQSGTMTTDYLYTGQRQEAELGLYYYIARWYDPAIGRFIQADSIVPNPASALGFDRYAYAYNNPLNYTDPSGHFPELPPNDGPCLDGNCDFNPPDEQVDMTEWLVNELANQAQVIQQDDQAHLDQCISGGNSFECYIEFVGYLYGSHLDWFGNYGKYDIKRGMKEIYGGAVVLCGNEGCSWVDYSTPGNIMYGYLSAVRGVSQTASWIAGGILESLDNEKVNWGYSSSWFDNPGDKAAVDFGYQLFEIYGNDLTVDEFKEALNADVLNTLQEPKRVPIIPPVPQNNQYPPGYFILQ